MTSTAAGVRLDGKAVVVTGAGRGVGEACARHAASLGACVLVNDIDPDSAERVAMAIRSAGGQAVAHPADVAVRSGAAGLVGRAAGPPTPVDPGCIELA